MRGLSTEEIMDLALGLVGWKEIPADSGIHVPGRDLKRILFTMDANVGLLHLARALGFDAVVAHHPCGVLYRRGEVYRRHLELLALHGVAAQKAAAAGRAVEGAVRRTENNRFRMLYNESPNQTVLEADAARLLGLPFMNVHNPLDEMGRRILQARVDEAAAANPALTLGEVLDLIRDLPEARHARQAYSISPRLVLGSPRAAASGTAFVHGALSAPSAEIIRCYWENGVPTVIALHCDFEGLERLREEGGGNLILTGHFLGDSIGMTPFIEALRGKGLEVACLGGIIDVSQNPVAVP